MTVLKIISLEKRWKKIQQEIFSWKLTEQTCPFGSKAKPISGESESISDSFSSKLVSIDSTSLDWKFM